MVDKIKGSRTQPARPNINVGISLCAMWPQAGGFMDLRYVRMKQGRGELKSKLSLDGGLFGIGDGILPPSGDAGPREVR